MRVWVDSPRFTGWAWSLDQAQSKVGNPMTAPVDVPLATASSREGGPVEHVLVRRREGGTRWEAQRRAGALW